MRTFWSPQKRQFSNNKFIGKLFPASLVFSTGYCGVRRAYIYCNMLINCALHAKLTEKCLNFVMPKDLSYPKIVLENAG